MEKIERLDFDSIKSSEDRKSSSLYKPTYDTLYGFDQTQTRQRANETLASTIVGLETGSNTLIGATSSFIPAVDNTYDIGTMDLSWRAIYAQGYYNDNGDPVYVFKSITAPVGGTVAADTLTDSLTFTTSDNTITATANPATDTIDFKLGTVSTTGFNRLLSAADDTIQEALDTLDNKAVNVTGDTMTGKLNLVATSTTAASTNFPIGDSPTSPVNGDVWHDGISNKFSFAAGSLRHNLGGCMYSSTANATVANTTTETTLIGAGSGTLVFPATYFKAGKTVRVKASGYFSTTGTPNLTITISFTDSFGTDILLTTGAVATAGTISNDGWSLEADITCRGNTDPADFIGQGLFSYKSADGARLVNTSPVSININQAETINVTATWGTASVSNTITCTNLIIEVIN